jgi:hypothetical protein
MDMDDDPQEEPIALAAYDALAESYAALVDTKPHNAYYERPVTLSLLPDVSGKRVLDAGCGPGVYAEWLVRQGAEVVAVDVNEKMVRIPATILRSSCSTTSGPASAPPVRVPFYRRPLGEVINPLLEAGFALERLLEPTPTDKFRAKLPEDYVELSQRPGFLCVRAVMRQERV